MTPKISFLNFFFANNKSFFVFIEKVFVLISKVPILIPFSKALRSSIPSISSNELVLNLLNFFNAEGLNEI